MFIPPNSRPSPIHPTLVDFFFLAQNKSDQSLLILNEKFFSLLFCKFFTIMDLNSHIFFLNSEFYFIHHLNIQMNKKKVKPFFLFFIYMRNLNKYIFNTKTK
jgi:hypothetical protein